MIREWVHRIFLSFTLLAGFALLGGFAYERWSRRSAAQAYPPPGRLIEHQGKLSHLSCAGAGVPTVILEAGLDANGSQTWATIQPQISSITRVCSYDRAGIMWSEARAEPRNADRIAEELHSLLDSASELPPYVIVGHSLGGLLARVYTNQYPEDVAGVVFVDASHPDQFDRYPTEVLQLIMEVESSYPSARRARFLSGIGVDRVSGAKIRSAREAYQWRSYPWGFLGERAAREVISEQAREAAKFDARPLVVLSAGFANPMPGVSDEVMERF